MTTDFSTLEKLYSRGVLDINGKDYINGTNSNIQINTQRDTFLPDNRFAQVDGRFMQNKLLKDTLELSKDKSFQTTINNSYDSDIIPSENTNKTNGTLEKVKNIAFNKITAGIAGALAFILSGRYLLKKLHIIK